MSDSRTTFKSKFGLILASVGSAVGLGNIWRFPYEAGQNGGGAFLLIYLCCVFVLGIPAIIFWICYDIFGIISIGVGLISFAALIGYILAGVFAFLGGYIAISAFKAILNHSGFSQFAYYCFGVAFLTFIIYLIT